jgi:hypothetical protein
MEAGEALLMHQWVVNHPTCHTLLQTTSEQMAQRLAAFSSARSPLQGWHGAMTWIPRFDMATDYEDTLYEDYSVLNSFRGILLGQSLSLKAQRLTAAWCANVLRMITPWMWLGASLADQVDPAALRAVATVTQAEGGVWIEKLSSISMDDFEIALLPILPVETTRMRLAGAAETFSLPIPSCLEADA